MYSAEPQSVVQLASSSSVLMIEMFPRKTVVTANKRWKSAERANCVTLFSHEGVSV